jgi:hypothetical protein
MCIHYQLANKPSKPYGDFGPHVNVGPAGLSNQTGSDLTPFSIEKLQKPFGLISI